MKIGSNLNKKAESLQEKSPGAISKGKMPEDSQTVPWANNHEFVLNSDSNEKSPSEVLEAPSKLKDPNYYTQNG